MRKSFFYLLLLILFTQFFSCSQDQTKEGKILARINDYKLTIGEFQYQLAAEIELDEDFKLTEKAKKEFLEELINKELLIQEAEKLKLDRKEKFSRTIERYWESTLIRDLMEIKGKEISQRTLVSREEVEAYYNDMKKSVKKLPPLIEVQEKFSKKLKEKKKTRMLMEWIGDLRKNANIKINQDFLHEN